MTATDQLWQIRHVVAHSASVVGALDAYRLKGAVASDESLVIDRDYLEFGEARLINVSDAGIRRVSQKILKDFLSQRSTGSWTGDAKEFSSLYLLGTLVGPRQDLPEVSKDDYLSARVELDG